jgi:cell division protease FtsH
LNKIIEKIKKRYEEYKEQYESFSLTKKIIHFIMHLIVLDLIITGSFLMLNNNSNTIKEDKSTYFSEYIQNTETLKNIHKINIYYDYDSIFVKVINKEFDTIKELEFNSLTFASFVRNYEPILIENHIKYDIFKKESPLAKFTFINFFMSNFSTLALVLLFLFIFEKQGLFGKSDKYKSIKPKNIKGDFNDLIGMKEIKSEILQLKDILSNREKYKEFAIEDGFNVLMSGPPGTGKTKMASFLAKELDVPFIVGTGNVETGFVAGGANVLKNLFDTARLEAISHPSKTCIIFLDEAQVLLVKRKTQGQKFEDDAINELLSQLDGINTVNDVNIIFIAASNFDESNMELDKAMLRRFHKKIFFRLPNKAERKDIFSYYLSKISEKHLSDNINISHLSEVTAQQSPAIIESIIKEAGLISINENKKIDTNMLDKAYERTIIGKTTYDKEKDKLVNVIAFHEIGHFIQEYIHTKNKVLAKSHNIGTDELFEQIRNNTTILKISVESIEQYSTLGYVLNKEEELNLKTKKDLENEIVTLYGGLAAEKIFFSQENDDNVTVGSSNDIEKVSNIFNIMINKLGMYSKNKKINLTLIDNIDFKEDNTKILLEKSEELYNQALKNVTNNKELITELAELLIHKKVINIIEALECVKNFEISSKKIN